MAEVMKPITVVCPDLETVAAYLDSRLSDRERARVTKHLSLCEDCYAVFAESARLHVAAEPARGRGAQGSRVWMAVPKLAWSSAGAALATAACVWLLVGSGRVMWSQRPGRELQALVAAVGTGRTIEPRLVGGFAHGPLLEAVRGRATADVVSPDVRIAAATLEKAVNERPTAQNLRALGAAHLIMGQFDTAIDALQSAVRQAPTDATVLSDLSAAYLVRGKNEGAPEDYARAASQADKATKANAVLPEALFNRALAFEALSLAREARESWEQYLRLDGRSAWADEARRHLQKLLQQSDARGSRPFILKEKGAMVT